MKQQTQLDMLKCPSLNPHCDGELKVSERETCPTGVESMSAGWFGQPISVLCEKCGKKWTKEHLATEGLNIEHAKL